MSIDGMPRVSGGGASGKRVLIVDDDLPLRGMLSAALRHHGYQPLMAGDGREAKKALEVHTPDLILLDLMMPDVNGWDLLQQMHDRGLLAKTRVVVISAHLRVRPEAFLQMGVSAMLPKPFNLDELLSLVDHLVS